MKILKNNILWVLIFIGMPILMNSQAANVTVEDEYRALENNFQVKNLSAPQLQLFQTKSLQQLKDFLNLADMIASKKYDTKLNEKLKSQALKSFSNSTDSLFFLQKEKLVGIPILDFLNDLENQKTTFPASDFSYSKFSTPNLLDDNYTWEISFEFSKKEVENKSFVADFILRKEKKQFGKKEKEVWEVFLKEIKEVKNKS